MARILIVDDEEQIARSSSAYLEALGHETTVGHCLARARELFDEAELDLVVVDVVLPDGSGFDFIEEVRATRPDLPALAMTGLAAPDVAKRADEVGVVAVLNKPFRYDELAKLAAAALGIKEQPEPGRTSGE